MSNNSSGIQSLISSYKQWQEVSEMRADFDVMEADDISSKMVKFYEKLRRIVDWKEEHLMRRIALKRILSRQFITHNKGEVAQDFLVEVCRAGFFPQGSIPTYKIDDVQKIIDKYDYVNNHAPMAESKLTRAELYTKLLEVQICEIEEILDPAPHIRADALTNFMKESVKGRLDVNDAFLKKHKIDDHGLEMMLFICTQQKLHNFDNAMVIYNVIKYYYPNWLQAGQELIEEVTKELFVNFQIIDYLASHPLNKTVTKICDIHNTPFTIMDKVLADEPNKSEKLLNDKLEYRKKVGAVYKKRKKQLKSNKYKSALFSTISVFLTNIFTIFIIEIPVANWLYDGINLYAALVDVLLPTALMFILIMGIRMPKRKNFDIVLDNIYQYSYEDYPRTKIHISGMASSKKNSFLFIIFSLIYYSFAIAFIGLMVWGLDKIGLPPLSIGLVVMFVSVISFTATLIKQRSRELHMYKEKVSLFTILFDPLAIPVLRLGRWLSHRWSKINIVSLAFNFIIEMPFSIVVETFEQWRTFIREKKEEIE